MEWEHDFPGKKRGRFPLIAPQAASGTFAVNSIPSAFITASVDFKVGLPSSLKER